MKIVHLGKYYPPAPGGIESHVKTLACGQAELGHYVSVLCVNHADKNGKDIIHSRWRKTSSFAQMDGNVWLERVGRLVGVNRLDVCPGLIGKIREATSQVDVVHLHTPNPLMLSAWWLAGNRDTPLIVTHHSDVIKQRLLQRLVAPIESRVYRAAKKILSDSPDYIEGSSILQKLRKKVEVLPLGIDLERHLHPGLEEQEVAKRLKETYGSPLWLMVGRMTYYKGYHVALEALGRVKGKLVVVGKGPLESELKSAAVRLGVSERVTWLPSVSESDLISLYHAATALWFPSIARSEGFGLVQVEAMACGCPVINTNITGSGVRWVSQDLVSGLTVPVGDVEQFAKAANRLVDNPDLRKRLSCGAKERALSEFDSKIMVRRSLELYKASIN